MPIERVIARQNPYFKVNIEFYGKILTPWKFAVFVADFRPCDIRREGRHKRHGHGVADAHKGRIRDVTRRREVRRRMRRRCQITNNRYQTANVTASLSRRRVTLTPLSRSSFHIGITIISYPAGQA